MDTEDTHGAPPLSDRCNAPLDAVHVTDVELRATAPTGIAPPVVALRVDWDARFRDRFADRMKITLLAIADYIDTPDAETRAAMGDTVHKLVGIAGALGRAEVSDRARDLDIALGRDAPPSATVIAPVVDVLATELERDRSG